MKTVALLLCLIGTSLHAAEFGALGGSFIGAHSGQAASVITNGSPTTLVFNTANNGWAARFVADQTLDVKSVAVNFSAITSPGTITARIETIDTASGKPTGTLYDANASKQFTPTTGWNVVTFDTPATTGLTVGTEYALVLIKDDSGTTCTLNARVIAQTGFLPGAVLTATDGSTRSNFAEVASNIPVAYFVMEDDSVQSLGCCSAAAVGSGLFYGADIVAAQKVVLSRPMIVRGIRMAANAGLIRVGTPAGDMRVRILDAANSAVSGGTITIDKDSMTNSSSRGLYIPLPNITLAAGTYRIAFDSASSANSSNAFGIRYATLPVAALQSSAFCYSESTNASSSFTWTDHTDRQSIVGFVLDSIPSEGSNTVDPLTGTIPGL